MVFSKNHISFKTKSLGDGVKHSLKSVILEIILVKYLFLGEMLFSNYCMVHVCVYFRIVMKSCVEIPGTCTCTCKYMYEYKVRFFKFMNVFLAIFLTQS